MMHTEYIVVYHNGMDLSTAHASLDHHRDIYAM